MQQSKSNLWHIERQWRLTASKFGEICKATESKDLELLCQSLFDPPKLANAAVNHGKTYESIAIKRFEEQNSLSVSKIGLCVNPEFPYLGASPDGIISEDSILEVKCPFSGRNDTIVPGKLFPFLRYDENNSISLRQNHNYYYQIIGQLAITKCKICYFFVYTLKDMFVERIEFDQKFFSENMLPHLKDFFENHFRPYVAKKL